MKRHLIGNRLHGVIALFLTTAGEPKIVLCSFPSVVISTVITRSSGCLVCLASSCSYECNSLNPSGCSHGIAVGSDWLGVGRPRDRSAITCEVKKFLFPLSSIPVLSPTQPPIQWVPRVKWSGREAAHLSTSVGIRKVVGLYIHCPIRLHGLVLM
jgi:hypothetical protein